MSRYLLVDASTEGPHRKTRLSSSLWVGPNKASSRSARGASHAVAGTHTLRSGDTPRLSSPKDARARLLFHLFLLHPPPDSPLPLANPFAPARNQPPFITGCIISFCHRRSACLSARLRDHSETARVDCACTALVPGLRCRDLRSFSLLPSPPQRRTRRPTQQNNERLRQTTRVFFFSSSFSFFLSRLSNSLLHPSPRPQCPPAWCDPLPFEPAAPVCVAARARPSACTKTAARPAKTAQKECTSVICHRRAWPITTARAQLAIPQRIAQRATLCRRPGPVPLTPGSPLWAQAEPDTYRPPPKSECFCSCFLTRAHPLPRFLLGHSASVPSSSAKSLIWTFYFIFIVALPV